MLHSRAEVERPLLEPGEVRGLDDRDQLVFAAGHRPLRARKLRYDRREPFRSRAGLPPPDLFIRTGGDHRVSNFLLWQLAYTELWFTETLWPALDAATLQRALDDFASRERRFGLTGAQVAGAHNGMTPA